MTISFIATENKHSWFFVKWTQYLTVISHSPANMTCDLAHGGVVMAHGGVVMALGGVVISHSPANMTCDLAHGGVVRAHGCVVISHSPANTFFQLNVKHLITV